MVASRDNFPLLDELLAEQQRLQTPVAKFSTAHDAGTLAARHTSLIPLTAPRPGEQYAFEVELDACTGCKSCVAACHSLNGLDDTETWRDVGLLVSPSRRHPFTQTITSACHHCADPACLNGCPVLAYEKDPVTGIVRHLDDQCIGCQYCILKCPYDAPKYNARLGIVRKCDMCHGRLAEGEAPACVQACPTHAIRIVTVAKSEPRETFLPAAPAPGYTQPTTRYVATRPLPDNLVAADAIALRPQPAHWPLVIMLTLMPTAVALSALRLNVAAVACGTLGLAASVLHLGQPRRAWRIFLGWRQSWLSREALAFGAWWLLALAALAFPRLATASAIVGALGLACSAMIYIDTRRALWAWTQTVPRFFGTATVVALALTHPVIAAFALIAKLAWESRSTFDGSVAARLQRGPLKSAVAWRDALGGLAVIGLLTPFASWALAPLFVGELLERHLFFRAVDAPKMPGLPV